MLLEKNATKTAKNNGFTPVKKSKKTYLFDLSEIDAITWLEDTEKTAIKQQIIDDIRIANDYTFFTYAIDNFTRISGDTTAAISMIYCNDCFRYYLVKLQQLRLYKYERGCIYDDYTMTQKIETTFHGVSRESIDL